MLENPKAVLATTWVVRPSVNATKVEKTNTDYIWLNPKCSYNGWSAAKFPILYNTKLMEYNNIGKRFNDYPYMGVELQAIGSSKWCIPVIAGKDIVWSLVKTKGL